MPDKKIIDLDALARYNEHIDEELALKADASDLEGYLPLTGGTIDGELVVQESEDNPNHNSTSIQNDVSRHHSNTRTTFDDVEISSDSITITHGRVRAYQKAQISQEGVCVTSGGTIHDYNPNEYLIEFPTDEWDDATGDHTFATREWVSVRVPEFTKTKSIDAGDYFLTCTADYDAVSGGLVKSYKWTKKEGDTFVFDPEYFVDVDTLDTADSDLVVIPASLNSMPILAGTNSVPYKLLGNTASFNQLARSTRGNTTINGITISWDGLTASVSGTATADVNYDIGYSGNHFDAPIGGHTYLLKGCPSGGSTSTYYLSLDSFGNDIGEGRIGTFSNVTGTKALSLHIKSGTTINKTFTIQLFDLTLTGEESLTLDQLKAKYNKYYPYNAGTLYPSIVSKVESWGANLFDGEWESGTIVPTNGENYTSNTAKRTPGYIAVYGGQTYTFENDDNGNHYLCEYDANHAFIKSTKYESSTYVNSIQLDYSTAYVRLVVQNATTKTNFHLGTATIGYKPYVGKLGTINLPSAPITLRGVNASQDELVFVEDGQGTYTAKLVRNRAVVDLGTIDVYYLSSSNRFSFYISQIQGKPNPSNAIKANLLCPIYTTRTSDDFSVNLQDMSISLGTSNLVVIRNTNYTDIASFKTAMSGVYMDYPLATPTEETLATGLTYEQVSLLFEEGGYMQVENTNSDYTHADSSFAFAVKNYRSAS